MEAMMFTAFGAGMVAGVMFVIAIERLLPKRKPKLFAVGPDQKKFRQPLNRR
jgi:hypothetical protein